MRAVHTPLALQAAHRVCVMPPHTADLPLCCPLSCICRPHHCLCERHLSCAPPGRHPQAAGPAGAGAARGWVVQPQRLLLRLLWSPQTYKVQLVPFCVEDVCDCWHACFTGQLPQPSPSCLVTRPSHAHKQACSSGSGSRHWTGSVLRTMRCWWPPMWLLAAWTSRMSGEAGCMACRCMLLHVAACCCMSLIERSARDSGCRRSSATWGAGLPTSLCPADHCGPASLLTIVRPDHDVPTSLLISVCPDHPHGVLAPCCHGAAVWCTTSCPHLWTCTCTARGAQPAQRQRACPLPW